MIRINNIKLNIEDGAEQLQAEAAKRLGRSDFTLSVERESLDARRRGGKHQLQFNYCVAVSMASAEEEKKTAQKQGLEYFEPAAFVLEKPKGRRTAWGRPVVTGFGPAGLFTAYLLAKEGYRPIVLERGDAAPERRRKVDAFWAGEAPLDPESNVQFGEGGAGTFSDGKLTSRSKDPWAQEVKNIFIEHGAPEEIRWSFEPHIGTDLLEQVVVSMRETIIRLGGELRFNTALEDLVTENGRVKEIITSGGKLRGPLFLAPGHSARDTFRMLCRRGLEAESKDFAVGFRIEHSQDWLNRRQYGKYAGHPRLGAASYRIHSRFYEGRNAYSFCMCPGGQVIAAASEPERLVTNGMSYHARDGRQANSAVLTGVRAGRDFGRGLLDGMLFQEKLEHQAYLLGGGTMYAPAMRLDAFLEKMNLKAAAASAEALWPTYRPGIREADLTSLYSAEITAALARGIAETEQHMPGFAAGNVWLTGAETRSSSPLRFLRDRESREALGLEDVYPVGEGAGYAGGIVSAALDGLRSAAAFIKKYKVPEG